METYIVLRRAGWRDGGELEAAVERSTVATAEMGGEVRWIRSYVMAEPNGGLGTVCVYQATDADALRRQADIADLPCDEVILVADTVIAAPDPVASG
jgi:hypothetical protein